MRNWIDLYVHVSKVWLQSFKNKSRKINYFAKIFPYLCCNACMVTTRDPQYFVALHSSPKKNWHYISEMAFFSACLYHNIYNTELMTFLRNYHRTRASSMATVRAWPRCRVPVTFGGGIHIENVWSTAWDEVSCSTWHNEVWKLKKDIQQKVVVVTLGVLGTKMTFTKVVAHLICAS